MGPIRALTPIRQLGHPGIDIHRQPRLIAGVEAYGLDTLRLPCGPSPMATIVQLHNEPSTDADPVQSLMQ